MKHHFTLTFRVAKPQSVAASDVASRLSGSDFHVEANPAAGAEFSVHFEREGHHATDLMEYARDQVVQAVPGATLVSVDMTEEPPAMSLVDDITKLVIRACQLFSDAELAHAWLSRPQEALGGQVPKAIMTDAEGRTRVARVLAGLEQNASVTEN